MAEKTFEPLSVLAEFAREERTGCWIVDTENAVRWKIYLKAGRLAGAANSLQGGGQIAHHLACSGNQAALSAWKSLQLLTPTGERGVWLDGGAVATAIGDLKTRGCLDDNDAVELARALSRDALESLVWLQTGSGAWLDGASAPAHLIAGDAVPLAPLLEQCAQRLRGWQALQPAIASPHQRLYLFDRSLGEIGAGADARQQFLARLAKLMRGYSIRQLAMFLKQDELRLAQFLHGYIKQGAVVLREPLAPLDRLPAPPIAPVSPAARAYPARQPLRFRVACIDDSPTVLDEIQRCLNVKNVELIKIDDPIRAASIVFRTKPHLVLMDITMPEINGYKLCGLLRNSESMAGVPIVMVSGNSGLIDKARAKLVGATGYLTKPFTPGELQSVVGKYLHAFVAQQQSRPSAAAGALARAAGTAQPSAL